MGDRCVNVLVNLGCLVVLSLVGLLDQVEVALNVWDYFVCDLNVRRFLSPVQCVVDASSVHITNGRGCSGGCGQEKD